MYVRILDIDECTTGDHKCKPSEHCVNKNGTYICQCASRNQLLNENCEGTIMSNLHHVARYVTMWPKYGKIIYFMLVL